ncbi:MAG: hypothetical protein PHT58_00740 [Eubacteriales bacterium]|nr:hypothetical protein [Eubacteriales bacterium]
MGVTKHSFVLVTGESWNGQHQGDIIRINVGDGFLAYDRLQTIRHELRHAYQYDVMADSIAHSEIKSTIDSWKTCSEKYGGSYVTFDGTNWMQYVTQPIEADAREFAGQPAY